MKMIMLLSLLPLYVFASSTIECLAKLPSSANISEQRVAELMIECSNMYLKGETRFLIKTKDSNAVENAEGILLYTACQEMTENVRISMNTCTEGKCQ